MSLDNKPKGNPNWVPGKSGNPDGRPKGAKSLKGLLKVAATLAEKKRHPVDELVRIADEAEKAQSYLIITNPGSTCWKVGEVVTRQELLELNSKIKHGNPLAEATNIPGSSGAGKELAAKIWGDLLKYCEPQKKPVETAPEKPTTPEESKAAADAAMKYLQELENGHSGENPSSDSSNPSSLDNGTIGLPPETGATSNLSSDKGI